MQRNLTTWTFLLELWSLVVAVCLLEVDSRHIVVQAGLATYDESADSWAVQSIAV